MGLRSTDRCIECDGDLPTRDTAAVGEGPLCSCCAWFDDAEQHGWLLDPPVA